MPKITSKRRAANNRRGRNQRSSTNSNSTANAVGTYAGDAWSLAKRTAVGLNEIRKLINIEEKYFDASGAGAIDYNGLVTCMSQMVQGLDFANRIGDSIRLQHITLRATWSTNATPLSTTVRCLIFRDLAQAGTIPTVANVLAVVGGTHITDCMHTALNLQRFSILYDETLSVSSVGDSQGFSFYDEAHNGHIRYLGTAAAAASNGLGSLYCLLCSDRIADLPNVSWTSRITYTDD
jgi:hypothetical protein